jgi:gamma-glutamylcyclotransferase (GGCT)/AIG2-like uncharacterized protein YtfP
MMKRMHANVFTYGSLMFPQVWSRVVAGSYRSVPATAPGHARFVVTGETYPGMVAQSSASVEGVLYLDVGSDDLAALDRFEGGEYRRAVIEVELDDGSRAPAATYIYTGERLSAAAWDPAAFELQRFLQSYCRNRL